MFTRRTFLKSGTAALAGTAATTMTARPLLASFGRSSEPVPAIQDPRIRELAQGALSAATAAGVGYADVRLTHTITRRFDQIPVQTVVDGEALIIGVRALVNGYWGFATSAVWSPAEAVRLAQVAVAQANTNTLSRSRIADLAPVPPVRDGHWETPVDIDPFSVYPAELLDYFASLSLYVRRAPNTSVTANNCIFVVHNRAFGSTDGSYCTQRHFLSQGILGMEVRNPTMRNSIRGELDSLTPAGLGLELYRGQPIREQIRALTEELNEDLLLPIQPIDVNLYDCALDALSVSRIVGPTIGRATELDRALGYEANAGGTSYLNRPADMMHTYRIGSPALQVSSNRSERGAASTVQWDDEGVTPETTTLVENGLLQRYQTTRESAGWIRGQGSTPTPFRSGGYAYAYDAGFIPLPYTGNLVMRPGEGSETLETLVSGMKKGILIRNLAVDMDFQQLNGIGIGKTYEIRNGKPVARLAMAAILFRAPEIWRSLRQLGGPASVRRFGAGVSKGEPTQPGYHSVSSVPAVFKDLTVIDAMRKV